MNKTIYLLWLQGFDNAPEPVNNCVKSWYYYNPDWDIIMIDNNNLHEYINLKKYIDISNKQIEYWHLSDIIRCILLMEYGGVWTDATTFCNKPLNDWLPEYIKEGFFAFNKPTTDRLISNWFLYAEKNNYIITKWCNSTVEFHKNNEMNYPFEIHHILFGKLYNSDKEFKNIWNKVPKLSAIEPHYFHHKGFFNDISQEVKEEIKSKNSPLYKLSHRFNFPTYDKTKNIFYLYNSIKNKI